MEDDSSNDVEAVEYINTQYECDTSRENRPIMLLLRCLIRNKQNTIMTNAQIIDILQREYDINIATRHVLEVDIYIKVIKKYLKDWPEWEELERLSGKLQTVKDFEAVSKVLNHKYKNLKEYLATMLEVAKPLAKEAVMSLATTVVDEKTKADTDSEKSTDVVMEIECSRQQLKHLFYRRPQNGRKNVIFNITTFEPCPMSPKILSFKDILNGLWTKISINLPFFAYTREVKHNFKHTLVNKARNKMSIEDAFLNTSLQMKINPNEATKNVNKIHVLNMFDDIYTQYFDEEIIYIIIRVFNILKTDLDDAPATLRIPGCYRKYASKHKYFQCFYVENKQNNDTSYDLQLEETISPTYHYTISKLGNFQQPIPPMSNWCKIECTLCNTVFDGSAHLKTQLTTHFNDLHQNEAGWQCTHCNTLYSMDYLCKHRWFHDC